MNSIIDYVQWRGDLSFSISSVNEVDGLIFSELSYLSWEVGLGETDKETLSSLWETMKDKKYTRPIYADKDSQLFEAVAHSRRFENVVVNHFTTETDAELNMQFSAVTFDLDSQTRFVAFRGTDGSIVGWKEDFNMAFSAPIPAQQRAIDYLTTLAEEDSRELYVGGHSKGGNLAVYAASFVDDTILSRISQIYNYDGPGLSDQVDAERAYQRLCTKVRTILPKASMIGMLLFQSKDFTIVESDSISIMQHSPFYWHVIGNQFIQGIRSKDSESMEKIIHTWLLNTTDKERHVLIDVFFDIVQATGATSFNRMIFFKLLQNPEIVFKCLQNIDPTERKMVRKRLMDLWIISKRESTLIEQQMIKSVFMRKEDRLGTSAITDKD